MKLIFGCEFIFYTSSMYEICLHCHWLSFSSFILNFGQCAKGRTLLTTSRNASKIPTGIPKSSRLRLLVSGNFKIISTLYSVTKPSDEISYYTTPSHLLYQNGDTMSSLHINGLLLISESEF